MKIRLTCLFLVASFMMLPHAALIHAQTTAPTFLRLAHFAPDVSAVDVYIGGELHPALDGLAYPALTTHLGVTPGTYEVYVVPAGEEMEAALVGPLELAFTAGHNYTLAAIGQRADESFSVTVIDETALFTPPEADDAPDQTRLIVLHALSEAPSIEVVAGDEETVLSGPLFFGELAPLAFAPETGAYPLSIRSDEQHAQDVNPPDLGSPQLTLAAAIGSGEDFDLYVSTTGTQNILDLAAEDGRLDALAAALQTSGLDEALRIAGPVTLFAPSDAAFAAAEIQEDNLAAVLSYHVVDGFYTAESLAEPGTLPAAMEAQIVESLVGINGVIHIINAVLMPPEG